MKRISTSLIRELVDNELFERGLRANLEKQALHRHADLRPRAGDLLEEQRELQHRLEQPRGDQPHHRREHAQAVRPQENLQQGRRRGPPAGHGPPARPGLSHARLLLLALARIPEEVRPVAAEPGHALRPGEARAHAHRPPEHLPRLDAGVLRRRARRRLHQHPLRAVPRRASTTRRCARKPST